MKVLVTGGSGFIGRALIAHLNEAGHEIVTTSRDPDVILPGATLRQTGELGPQTDWREALRDIEAVVHLAARVHVMKEHAADPLGENRRINTEGTRKLAMDAAEAGVRHIIFLSTIKVNGEATQAEPFRANNTPAPEAPYAVAKLEAEQALLDVAGKTGMRVNIIRPPLVYGPGVRGNFLSLLNLCNKGWPLPVGGIDNRRSLIYVGNLVDLIGHFLESSKALSYIYLCRDGEDVSTPQLFRATSKSMGKTPLILPTPAFLLSLAGKLFGKSAAISRLIESLAVDDGPTRDDLGWTPPFSMLQGLQKTADWFNNRRQH